VALRQVHRVIHVFYLSLHNIFGGVKVDGHDAHDRQREGY
jgi:hypothetical protein